MMSKILTEISYSTLMLPIFFSMAGIPTVQAQSIIVEPNSTGTLVTPQGNRYNITGGTPSQDGANLFHSFTQFNLKQNQIADFQSNPAIRNIFGRISGGDPSYINGLIQVTGGNSNLYLMNPAGIVFGQNASLNVPASFTVTTANAIGFNGGVLNATGDNHYATLMGTPSAFIFSNSSAGAIINVGNLTVPSDQNLSLLGRTVINTGTLSAPGGTITIAAIPAENTLRISQAGHLLSLDIFSESSNSQITALSLPELLTGGEISNANGLTLQPDGSVQLTGSGVKIPQENGVAIASGNINVTGSLPHQAGGTLNILGNNVGVIDSTIHASGMKGGGTVRIGGDFQGKGSVFNATNTYINRGSMIQADSLFQGSGGNVFIWSDQTTRFDGNIRVRGIDQGGFVEVSGKQNLIFDGTVDLSADNGNFGTLLLDPANIIITDSETATHDSELDDSEILQTDGNLDETFTISRAKLESLTGNITLEATNDITIEPLSTGTLNLQTAFGEFVTFTADADTNGIGIFSMNSTDTITTQGGSLRINAAQSLVTGNIITNGGSIFLETNNNNGNISIQTGNLSTTSDILNAGILNIDANALGNASITVGNLDSSVESGVAGGMGIRANSLFGSSTIQTGNINASANSGFGGSVDISATSFASGSSLQIGNINTAATSGDGGTIRLIGPLTLTQDTVLDTGNSAGDIHINNTVNGNFQLTLNAGTGNVQLNDAVGTFEPLAGFNLLNAQTTEIADNITTNNGNVSINSPVTLTNDVTITTGTGNVLFNNTIDGNQQLTLDAGTGNVQIDGAVGETTPLTAFITLNAQDIQTSDIATNSGLISMNAAGNVVVGNLTTSTASSITGGNVEITAGNITTGDINTDALDDGGVVNLSATTGNLQTGTIITGGYFNFENSFLGSVTLEAPLGDITVESIDTRGSYGGDVTITAGGLFRATGWFLSKDFTDSETTLDKVQGESVISASIPTSIGVSGLAGGGTITIQHGGNSLMIGPNFATDAEGNPIYRRFTLDASGNLILGDPVNINWPEGSGVEFRDPNTGFLVSNEEVTAENTPLTLVTIPPDASYTAGAISSNREDAGAVVSMRDNPLISTDTNLDRIQINFVRATSAPIPEPTPAPEPIPEPTPAPIPEPTPVPVPEPTPAPVPTPEPTPVPVPEPTPAPNPVPAPTPIPTSTGEIPTQTPNPVPTPNPIPTPTPQPTHTPNPVPTPVPAPNPIPTPVPTSNPVPTPVPAPIPTPEPTSTPNPVPTPTQTPAPISNPIQTPAGEPNSVVTNPNTNNSSTNQAGINSGVGNPEITESNSNNLPNPLENNNSNNISSTNGTIPTGNFGTNSTSSNSSNSNNPVSNTTSVNSSNPISMSPNSVINASNNSNSVTSSVTTNSSQNNVENSTNTPETQSTSVSLTSPINSSQIQQNVSQCHSSDKDDYQHNQEENCEPLDLQNQPQTESILRLNLSPTTTHKSLPDFLIQERVHATEVNINSEGNIEITGSELKLE